MGKKNIKEYDKSYHLPETIQIEYCAAVSEVVLRNHAKVKELMDNVRDFALFSMFFLLLLYEERIMTQLGIQALPSHSIPELRGYGKSFVIYQSNPPTPSAGR